MIPKVLVSGYNDSDMFPPSTLIPLFANGSMDKETLQKRASMFLDIIPTFKRKPGYQYIHLISVADGCTYGCNSRADFYNGDACEINIPTPKSGSSKVIVLDGGISKYHDTFLKSGGVYTEHRNKHSVNPPKSQGYIVAAGYNEPMKRGELIIGVNDDAWHDDLERLANGTPMKFSIGFDAVHDICSKCGNIAHTEDEHCDHIKNSAGKWDEDGNAIYMISDKGVYHDISRVRVPAERIAFSIRKVASGASMPELEVPGVNPLALPYMLKSASALRRYNAVKKLARMEKQITAFADPRNQKLLHGIGFAKRANDRPIDELHKFIDFALTSEVLGGLQKRHCVLAPEEFLRMFVPESATPRNVEILQGGLPGIFGDLWDSADFDEFCEESDYAGTPCVDIRIIRPIDEVAEAACISPEICMHRQLDLQKPTNITIVCVRKADNALSREYASYLTDACADLDDQECLLALLRALTQQGK